MADDDRVRWRIPWLLVLGLAACKPDPDDSAEVARLRSRAEAIAARWLVLRERVPDPNHAEYQVCPDAEGRVVLAEYGFLQRYARDGGGDPPEEAAFRLLTSEQLRRVATPAGVQDKRAATDVLFRMLEIERDYPYLAIARPTRREAPRLEGEKYHAGAVAGWITVFSLESGQPICATDFQAASSPEVLGADHADPAELVRRDFAYRLRRALESAFQQMGRGLSLRLE